MFYNLVIFQVLLLLQKTNEDWWQIQKQDGTEGFVPANYVKEIEPLSVKRAVKKAVKVPEKVKVKKTVMKKEVVQVKRAPVRRAPSGKPLPCLSIWVKNNYPKPPQISLVP